MLRKAVLISAVFTISVVTANPLLQALVSQNCPICEQNALKNQIQNLLLQQTSSYFQPYAQMLMNQPIQGIVQPEIPAKRSCSFCPQNIQNHNCHVPTCQQQIINQPYCQNQQTNKRQENQIPGTINKILSNPTLRTILDPNTRIYNQNGHEVPKNGPSNNGQPNVINNYIIVPPELLLEANKSGPKNDIPEQRRIHNKEKGNERTKPKTDNSKRENKRNKVTNAVNSQNLEGTENNGERKKRRRQKNRNAEIKVKVVNENSTKDNNQIESPQLIENEEEREIVKEETTNKIIENIDQITENKVENKTDIEVDNHNNNVLINDDETLKLKEQSPSINNQTQPQIKVEIQASKNATNEKPRKKHKQSSSINKNVANVFPPRNPREEAVIRDFRQKFPNIPEEVVRDLLAHMKRQLEKQNLGVPAFYYPQFPISYDQLYRNQFTNFPPPAPVIYQPGMSANAPNHPARQKTVGDDQNKSKKRRKNRRKNRQQRRRPKNNNTETCNTTIEPTPTVVVNEIEMTTTPGTSPTLPVTTTAVPTMTTERLTTTTDSLPTVEDTTEPMETTISSEIIKETQTIETTTPKISEEPKSDNNSDNYNQNEEKVPELGTEDVVPLIYMNDLIDEYYPDFTGDHQYYSNEDFSFIRLDDDRFHYTTDKNFQLEELNRERRRFDHNSENKLRRPGHRYIFRLKNRDKFRRNFKFNGRDRSKISTTHSFVGITEKPQIKVTVKYEDITSSDVKNKEDTRSESVENYTEKAQSISDIEEIQFRTPPTLEKIDFETKQINKKIYFHDDTDFKTSSYSDVKTPQYISNEKAQNIITKPNPLDEIETVYARSKVVTYGKPVLEENLEENGFWMDKSEDFHFDYDDKTVVVAKPVTGDYW